MPVDDARVDRERPASALQVVEALRKRRRQRLLARAAVASARRRHRQPVEIEHAAAGHDTRQRAGAFEGAPQAGRAEVGGCRVADAATVDDGHHQSAVVGARRRLGDVLAHAQALAGFGDGPHGPETAGGRGGAGHRPQPVRIEYGRHQPDSRSAAFRSRSGARAAAGRWLSVHMTTAA